MWAQMEAVRGAVGLGESGVVAEGEPFRVRSSGWGQSQQWGALAADGWCR